MPAHISEFTFPLDHVIAQQHQGPTTYDNLALSCPHCNYHKGPNIAGNDPVTANLRGYSTHDGIVGVPTLNGRAITCRQDRRRPNDHLRARDKSPR